MMYELKAPDGQVYRGGSAIEVIQEMRRADFGETGIDAYAWMEQMAQRVLLQTGETIGWTNAELFLADLKRLGLLSDVDLGAESN